MSFDLQKNSKNRRNPPIHLLLFLVLIAVMTWAGFKLKSVWAPYNELTFNASNWRSAHGKEGNEQRAKMAGDLTKNHLKIGMTEKQITQLLGLPDRPTDASTFSPGYDPQIHTIYQYDMGYAQMDMAGGHHLLRLYFDSRGRCLSFEITKD